MQIKPKRVFVLGAGFSHYISGNRFPLGVELTEIVRKLNIPALNDHFQDAEHSPDNIENILSKMELDRDISNEEKETNKKKIFIAFQKKMLVKDVLKNPETIEKSKDLIKKLFKRDDVIITLNYDLLLEHLLSKSDINMWSPCGNGYGNKIESQYVDCDDEKDNNKNKNNIRILKLHGSYNFFTQKQIDTKNYSKSFDVLINGEHPDFLDMKDMFENLPHSLLTKDSKIHDSIVLPTYVKPFAQNRSFVFLWHEAIAEMKNADIITIIGYSFPKEDVMMSFLFSCPDANEFENTKKLKINILNKKDDCKNVKEHICNVVRANRENHIDWTPFELDSSNIDEAYDNLISHLNNEQQDIEWEDFKEIG